MYYLRQFISSDKDGTNACSWLANGWTKPAQCRKSLLSLVTNSRQLFRWSQNWRSLCNIIIQANLRDEIRVSRLIRHYFRLLTYDETIKILDNLYKKSKTTFSHGIRYLEKVVNSRINWRVSLWATTSQQTLLMENCFSRTG